MQEKLENVASREINLFYQNAESHMNHGPMNVFVSGFGDMPTEFNVSLLRGAPNPKAVFSSKAVGEPPLFLASSVFFAAKEAIRAARIERGLSKKFNMNAPATGTVIQNQ